MPEPTRGTKDRPTAQVSGTGGETIYDGPASQWTNLTAFIVCACLFAAALLARGIMHPDNVPAGPIRTAATWLPHVILAGVVFAAIRAWWRVRFLVYRITIDRIEIERGCIAKRVDCLDLFRVVDLRLRISVVDRLCHIGNIVVTTTDASSPTLIIGGIPRPRMIYDRLKQEALRADRRRGVVHIER